MEESLPGSAASGIEELGTDDTTVTEGVEPSSFVAAGDSFCLSISTVLTVCCRCEDVMYYHRRKVADKLRGS